MQNRCGCGQRPIHQLAFQPFDLLAQRWEEDRVTAAGADRLGQRQAALSSGDREDAFAASQVVHQKAHLAHAMVQVTEVVMVQDL